MKWWHFISSDRFRRGLSLFRQNFVHKSKQIHSRHHSYNTRTRNTLNHVFCRTSITQHSLSFSAPNVWNEIRDKIKSLPSLSSFKCHLKQYFFHFIALISKFSYSINFYISQSSLDYVPHFWCRSLFLRDSLSHH